MTLGCGGGSDVCRSLAAYGTATKAVQLFNTALPHTAPSQQTFPTS